MKDVHRRRLAGAALAALACAGGAGRGAGEAAVATPSSVRRGSAVVAVVNGKLITFEDLWMRVGRELEYTRTLQSEEQFRAYARDMLDRARTDLIERTVLLARAAEEDIKIDDRDIDRYAERDMERMNMQGENLTTLEDYWHATEEKTGFSEKKWREELRARVTIGHLFRKYVWMPDFFSPALVRRYYREHPDEFQEGGFVTVRHVYVRRELAEHRRAVDEIEQALARGEDFKEIAVRMISQGLSDRRGRDGAGKFIYRLGERGGEGASAADCDGDLETLREPIPQIVARLRPGEVSARIQMVLGTHFVQLVERSGGRLKSFAEVQGEIHKKLTREVESRAEDEYVRGLVAKADVVMLPLPAETPLGRL
ncbi:MAG TPA: hypothetical protein DCM87_18710 [Planctomycetes bacterium]|nr:hypothetical protein [Planctomycetota bacterium]